MRDKRKQISNSSRRKVLKTSGAAISAGLLAGCTGDDSGGDSNSDGDGDADGSNGDSDGGNSNGNGETPTYRVGSSSESSGSFAMAQAMQAVARENTDNFELSAQTTPGTTANPVLYDDGELDMYLTSNEVYIDVMEEQGEYVERDVEDVPPQGFFGVPQNLYAMGVEGTNFETLEDLRGQNVWPMWPGATPYPVTRGLFEEWGLWEDLEVVNLEPSDVPGAIDEGRIDAFIVSELSGVYAGWTAEVDARHEAYVISMTDQQRSTLQDMTSPAYSEHEITSWEQDIGMDGHADSWALLYQWCLGEEMSTEHANELVTILHENADDLMERASEWPDFSNAEELTTAVMEEYTVHPGAAEAFRELDVWDDSWQEA